MPIRQITETEQYIRKCTPTAVKNISTDNVVYDQDDIKYDTTVVISKNTVLSAALDKIVQFFKIVIDDIKQQLNIINVGTGAKIYSGNTLLGNKKLRTLTSSDDSVSIQELEDEIDITVLSDGGSSIPTLQQVFDNSYPPFATVNGVFVLTSRDGFTYSSINSDTYAITITNKSDTFGNYRGEFTIANGRPAMSLTKDNNKHIRLEFRDPTLYSSAVYIPQPSELNGGINLTLCVNGNCADDNGNISLSSITTTFTTNDDKIVTVTNGIITNVQ
jgi:hypothetical protein